MYPSWYTLSSIAVPLAVFLIGVALLLLWPLVVFNVLPGISDGPPPSSLLSKGYPSLLMGTAVLLALGGSLLNLYTEVIVLDEGIKVRIFAFIWIFIPWKDVLDIMTPSITRNRLPHFWRFVRVRRLSIFHRMISSAYGTGWKPVFVINEYMEGYDELTRIIEEHVRQN